MAGSNDDSAFIEFVSNNINALNQIDHAVARKFGLPPYPSFDDLLNHDRCSPSSGLANPVTRPTSNVVREPQRLPMGQSNQDHQGYRFIYERGVRNMSVPQTSSMSRRNRDLLGHCELVQMPTQQGRLSIVQNNRDHQGHTIPVIGVSNMPVPQSPPVGPGVSNNTSDHDAQTEANGDFLAQLPQPPFNTLGTPVANSRSSRYDQVPSPRQVDPATRSRNVSQAPAISNASHRINGYLNTWQAINIDRRNDITNVGGNLPRAPAAERGVTRGVNLQKRKGNDDDEIEGLNPPVANTEETTAAKRQRLEAPGNSRELPGFPSSKDPLPADWTLELIVTKYPNHTLVPSVLDAFTQYFWTGGDIYKSFSPEVCQGWNQVFPGQGTNALHKRLISRWRKMGIPSLTSLLQAPKIVRCFNNGTEYFGKSNPGNLDLNPRAPKKPIKKE
ncbi:hypothetical protein LTS17_001059 [Exophiala oligosperma]